METCRVCVSPANPRRIGSLFRPHLFWIFVILSSFFAQVVQSSPKNDHHSQATTDNDDDFADFAEFDDLVAENTGGGGDEKSKNEPKNANLNKNEELDDQNSKNDEAGKVQTPMVDDDLDGVVEEELDEEEFTTKNEENFDKKAKNVKKSDAEDSQAPKQLKITDVPAHLRNNWSNFQMELLMLLALAVYLINYALGKAKNHKLATFWFENSRDILYSNFEVVGDDGTTQEVQRNILMKESDNSYSLWCSGRPGCQGALVQLNFLKRQDLVSMAMQLFKPQNDKITVRFTLNNEDLDSCVFCLGKKKSLNKLVKDMTDLSQFCTEKKNMDRLGLPESFTLYAETAEVTSSIIDSKTLPILQKYEDLIDYIHVSDQYSGLRVTEGETQSKLPETCRVVIFQFDVPGRLSANEKSLIDLKPLLSFTFYCLDKIRRFRLSREAKIKCDKNRLLAQETYLKQTHAQRQEAAQTRREEKARERKERVLLEEDPEKQRRLEKLEQKREAKKRQPRLKQLKIKAG